MKAHFPNIADTDKYRRIGALTDEYKVARNAAATLQQPFGASTFFAFLHNPCQSLPFHSVYDEASQSKPVTSFIELLSPMLSSAIRCEQFLVPCMLQSQVPPQAHFSPPPM